MSKSIYWDFENWPVLGDAIRYEGSKIFGLLINAERLSEIRNERRPGSNYAKCKKPPEGGFIFSWCLGA